MPRNTPPTGKLASVKDRIIGGTTFVLTIACLSVAANTHDAQWQLFFIITGLLYFMTTIGLVTENGVG